MTRDPARRLRRWAAFAVGLVLTAGLAGPAASAPPPRYTNPVSESFADTFADPAIIEAKDGWWYAYSTADPLRAGDEPGVMHIARTRDFVDWQYRGTVFDESNRPAWATASAGLWAPDVRYVGGRYVIYFTVTDTTLNDGDDSAIGVATAPTPTGPWTPSAAPLIDPRPAPDEGYFWTFDPAMFTDTDGQSYLYYGSYFGGVFVRKLTADGLRATGTEKQVAINDRYEGSYVVRHDGWYYLMGSSANCCAGPATGYSVFSGRSRSPLGPFRDADGFRLDQSRVGGTVMLTQNGNRWIGAGHHAIATDHAGRDWVVYHALDRNRPWLEEPFEINRRPMLIDRLDWIDGWPRTRAGAGPSESAQPAPVTGTDLGIDSADPARAGFVGLLRGRQDLQAGRTAQLRGTARTRSALRTDAVRVRLDFDANRPLQVDLGARAGVRVQVDPQAERLSISSTSGRRTAATARAPRLSADGWQTLVIETGRAGVTAEVSEGDLNDPFAVVGLPRRGVDAARAPLTLRSRDAVVDNVSVRPLAAEAAKPAPVPRTRGLVKADEFTGELAKDWRWVRRDPNAVVSGGRLSWPLQAADLVGDGNTASVLLDDATPDGNWIAETKLDLDLGIDSVRNYQQAGLIAYAGDDDFARLSSVAIWNTRQIEYGRELAAAPNGDTSYGGALIGTPAPTVWLRLAHTRNAAGEHLYRAGSSRDGRSWTWGAVWTFDADTSPRIGLVAHGGAEPPVTAAFDYLRFYRSSWTGPNG